MGLRPSYVCYLLKQSTIDGIRVLSANFSGWRIEFFLSLSRSHAQLPTIQLNNKVKAFGKRESKPDVRLRFNNLAAWQLDSRLVSTLFLSPFSSRPPYCTTRHARKSHRRRSRPSATVALSSSRNGTRPIRWSSWSTYWRGCATTSTVT